MKITICTFGSRGDTQPYIALALGLQQAGHQVTLVASASHGVAEWIRSYGLEVVPLRFSMQDFAQSPDQNNALKGRNPLRILREFRSGFEVYLASVLDDCWNASHDADYLMLSSITTLGLDMARQRNIPVALLSLTPIFPPTRAFPLTMLPFRFSLGGLYNRLTYALYWRVGWLFVGGMINRWRTTRLGVSPWRSAREIVDALGDDDAQWLNGFSPHVLPKPPEWGANHHVTGYWFLDAPPDWQPPEDLVRFLESGPAPVYVGFGSMSEKDPERLTRLVLRALELSGQRGLLLTGWGAVARLPTRASVFYMDDVPHSWLFPRMAAVVHHGGAGTTAAGLRAGVPSLITPFLLDQYAWADAVAKLGVGIRLADSKRLTAEKLARAIQTAVTDSALRARATVIGEQIRAEDGVAYAVQVIERHAAAFGSAARHG